MQLKNLLRLGKDTKATTTSNQQVSNPITGPVTGQETAIIKPLSPDYLWNPPYGRPRYDDVVLERNLCKTAYIKSIVWTLANEVATTDYEIVPKKQYVKNGVPVRDFSKDQERILEFFDNPNGNDENLNMLLQKVTTDILEIESGVIVKVFNPAGQMVQLLAVDGATILKNPDEHGYYGNRDDIIPFTSVVYDSKQGRYVQTPSFRLNSKESYKEDLDRFNVKDRAAYFQFGHYVGMPIPFGKREIVYMSRNPRTDTTYAYPPAAILGDVLYTLIYGSSYNNAFYTNNNLPDGILTLLGAQEQQLRSFKEQFENKFVVKDSFGNSVKKFFKLHVTASPVDFKPFMLEPAVMQVLEQQQWFIKLVWACFGIPGEEMGFTDSTGSKNVSESQTAVHKRKAIQPILRLIEYHINSQIMPEFGVKELEFKFKSFDLDEEIKKQTLYQLQMQNNIITPNEIRALEGKQSLGTEGNKTSMERQAEQFAMNNDALRNNQDSAAGDVQKKSLPSKEEQDMKGPLDDLYDEVEQQLLTSIAALDNDVLGRLR